MMVCAASLTTCWYIIGPETIGESLHADCGVATIVYCQSQVRSDMADTIRAVQGTQT